MKRTVNCIINKPISTKVLIPGSKSITNRALLLASLASGVSELKNILLSDDTLVFIAALRELGVVITVDEQECSCVVTGVGGSFPKKEASLWCGDAATAERFLLAACGSSDGIYHLDASQQLKNRPIKPLLRALAIQGVKFQPNDVKELPVTLFGKQGLDGGELEIDGSQSGQFASALLMSAPFSRKTFLLSIDNLVSEPYVDMTCSMMADFGVVVKRLHYGCYCVPVPQRYNAREYVVEPDLSTASYFFAAAALTGGEITIQSIQRAKSIQADVEFLTILEKMGCTVDEKSTGLTVKGPAELSGVNVDMRHCSDVMMSLAALAPFAKSPTTITNIAHSRFKESDRIAAMQKGLEALQVKVESGPDWIKIYPSLPKGNVVDSFYDHRIAMAFAVVGLRVPGVVIKDAECVSKTCPEFFSLWEKL